MTGEEMQRAIDFILAQQAKFVEQDHQMQQRLEQTSAEHTRRLEEMSAEHLSRMAVLEEIVMQNRQLIQTLAERQLTTEDDVTAQRERLEEDEKRIARFERSYLTISDLLAKHDAQLVAVTDSVNTSNAVSTTLGELVAKHDAQLISVTDSINTTMRDLLAKHDAQLVTVTSAVNKVVDRQDFFDEQMDELKRILAELVLNVNRYISARNNGSNGTMDN